MSFGGGYNGGHTRFTTKVFLNIYDLSPANEYLYAAGLGLHHSGVEILGTEYSFASGAGIFENSPGEARGAKFRERIEVGFYNGGSKELKQALDELRDDFGPGEYNLVLRNCNHFANGLCWKLLGIRIPGYVNRLAAIGKCCSCLLPKDLLENAPVGDPNGKSFETSFLVRRGNGASASSSSSVPAFSGAGSRLGSSSGSSARSSSNQDDLTDRREKARKAALARLEKQQEQSKGD